MRLLPTLTALAALTCSFGTLLGQETKQPASPPIYQTTTLIKVAPAKRADFTQFMNDTARKVAETRLASGQIISWTLLRSVMPAGEEARADYMISTLSEGIPPEPLERAGSEALLKKAGVKMSLAEFITKRESLGSQVAAEMWRISARVSAPQKGHYLFLNYMKVTNATEYGKFTTTVWRPLMEHWVKEGAMSGWIYATKVLPSGSDTAYAAYTADMFPSWTAAFAARPTSVAFQKAHPGKPYEETMRSGDNLRSLARRELWVVVDRVAK